MVVFDNYQHTLTCQDFLFKLNIYVISISCQDFSLFFYFILYFITFFSYTYAILHTYLVLSESKTQKTKSLWPAYYKHIRDLNLPSYPIFDTN